MKCPECNLYWFDEEAGCAICHADPNWPAPCEYDDEEDEQYILTLDKFLKGLRLAIKDGYGNDWFGDDARLDCAMIDGEAADVIVQCALFGEVQFG